MKKIITHILLAIIVLISPLSYSSVLSDKMSGGTQSSNRSQKTDVVDSRATTQPSEKPKETIVNNPKMDQFMGLSSSKIKLYFGIFVIIGFFIFGFGRYFLTGKQ